MHAKTTTCFIVPSHVNEEDLKFVFMCGSEFLHHRLHLFAGYAAHGPKFQHYRLAVLFSPGKHAVNFARLAVAGQELDAYYNCQRCSH